MEVNFAGVNAMWALAAGRFSGIGIYFDLDNNLPRDASYQCV
jgi:hypothetical protein